MPGTDLFTNRNKDNALLYNLTRFNGFYDNIYKDSFVGGTSFVFVTKPLLFLDYSKGSRAKNSSMAFLNMTRDPLFTQYINGEFLNDNDKEIIGELSYNTEYSRSAFLPVFTNECKNFDSTDVTMDQGENFDTKQGFKEILPTFKSPSEAGNFLTLTVTEDSNLTFTKMMQLWVNYISNITDGTFDANPDMVLNGTIDYMCSIYYFVLAPDGRTLKYWSRYTGCWPNTIPYSAMRSNRGQADITELNIPFVYNVKEDMNPKILEEFNMLSLKITKDLKNVLDNEAAGITYYNEVSGQYSAIKNSPLLNLDNMKSIPGITEILNSKERDPLIIYVPAKDNGLLAGDSTEKHFELLFDDYGYKSNLIPDIFEQDDYYINDTATNFIKKGQYINEKWNQTDFWKTETIE